MHAQVRNFLLRYPTIDSIGDENRAAGVTLTHIEKAAVKVHIAGDPLRDSIVLRKAREIAAFENGPAFEIWTQVQPALKARLYESTWRMWVEPVEVVAFEDGYLILDASDAIRTWVQRRYLPVIEEALPERPDLIGVRFR